MSNERTAENYWSIEIKQFRDLLKLEKSLQVDYTFTQSRQMGREKEIIRQEKVTVSLNGKKDFMLLGGRMIPITKTPCNYGQTRYWFGCPVCNQKVTRLFLHGGESATWKCRNCANLVYASQQVTKGDYWTWYYKAQNIAQRLNPDYWEDGFSYLQSHPWRLFPVKPKGMQRRTYERLRDEFTQYVEKGNVINAAQLGLIINKHQKDVDRQ